MISQEVDDFKSVLYDAHGHEFLTGVTAFAHEATCETFDDWAGCFAEAFDLVATGGVGEVDCVVALACDVVLMSE